MNCVIYILKEKYAGNYAEITCLLVLLKTIFTFFKLVLYTTISFMYYSRLRWEAGFF